MKLNEKCPHVCIDKDSSYLGKFDDLESQGSLRNDINEKFTPKYKLMLLVTKEFSFNI